ncbi:MULTISPECIES: hypothetical protein [unclassified Arthrobacter]|uniref:hypothetical protein n=1 Tax=unclassified Arthrobacter TaxID=235627 RepID=UPI001C85C82F|nr:hypothetical protein [Arthrobacter sp. MAHUQ-56]MBX7442920.1 hypothetical protein [Arthrobacter sp. MAHUQ-56]
MRVNAHFDALDAESRNAVSLAKSGLKLLGEMRYPTIGLPAVFSCLALGSEKLLKLTYGVSQQAQGHSWPTKTEMREYGHNIWKLDTMGRSLVLQRAHLAADQLVVAEWVERVQTNPWIDQLLDILSEYGSRGRFHYLDRLANPSIDPKSEPSEQWKRLAVEVLKGDDHSEHSEVLTRKITERLDEAFRDWWTMYTRAWVFGVFGGGTTRNHGYTLEINSRTSPGLAHHDR